MFDDIFIYNIVSIVKLMEGGVLTQLDGARQAIILFISQYTAVSTVGSCNGIYIYVCVCVCLCICVCVCIYMCVCVYIYVCVCIYIYI